MSSFLQTLAPNEQGFITVDGFRLNYIFWPGEKTTVLALHGFGGRAETYRHLAPWFQEEGVGLLSISLPFHGESKQINDKHLKLTEFIPALAATLRTIGLPNAPIIAHSFGGRLATTLSVLEPDFTRQLFLLSTGGFYPMEEYMFKIMKMWPISELMKTDWFAGFISGLLIQNLNTEKKQKAIESLRGLANSYPDISLKHTGIMGRLYNYKGNVQIIWGEYDGLVPAKFAQEIAQHFSDSEVKIFEKAGHMLIAEQPQAVARYILGKLRA